MFIIFNPNTSLIGASAGISGIIGSAFVLKPKQAIVGLIAVAIIVNIVIFASQINIDNLLEQKKADISIVEQEIIIATEKNDIEKVESLKPLLDQKKIETFKLEEGIRIQSLTPTDTLVHSAGALVGILYLIFFRKKEFVQGLKEYKPLFRLLRISK